MKSVIEYNEEKREIEIPPYIELMSLALKELSEAELTDGVWKNLFDTVLYWYTDRAQQEFRFDMYKVYGEFFITQGEELDYVVFS